MDWLFSGLGTLLVGLVIGGSVGGVVAWKVSVRSLRQSQKAGDGATQTQIGGDQGRGGN